MTANKNTRRDFLKKSAIATAGITAGAMTMSAKSYGSILGANEQLNVAIVGLGRRLGAYIEPISLQESNVKLLYLCDVMESQMTNAAKRFANKLDYNPTLESDFF
nr:twin-arginine translocation signal domain-containing protein [Prolixibacteraceae bacterium]